MVILLRPTTPLLPTRFPNQVTVKVPNLTSQPPTQSTGLRLCSFRFNTESRFQLWGSSSSPLSVSMYTGSESGCLALSDFLLCNEGTAWTNVASYIVLYTISLSISTHAELLAFLHQVAFSESRTYYCESYMFALLSPECLLISSPVFKPPTSSLYPSRYEPHTS